ncbi:MAG: EAL domain-containing protein [Pseudomonadota bacterium]
MKPLAPSLARHGRVPLLSGFGLRGRVMGAVLVVMLALLALAGQQILQVARQNGDTGLRVQAAAQLAALTQAVADSVIVGDYAAVRAQLKTPIAQGNLLYVEYTASNGFTLREDTPRRRSARPDWFARLVALDPPRLLAVLEVGGKAYGRLAVQPSPHAYEDFLWQLGTRLFGVLTAAFILLGWLIHLMLKFNLRGLDTLRTAARQVESGDYSARLPVSPGCPPEMRDTLRGFNHMNAALERLLTDLGEQQKALDSSAAVAEAALDGTITYVNELFCVLSGYTREELIGQNFRILNSGWHDRTYFENLWQTITAGRTWRGEICNRARDGRPFWMASTILPIKGEDGLPQKYLSIRFDVTQRKLDEAALEHEKERWQVTLQSINDAVIVTDARNRVVYLNPSAESLLGSALEDAAGQPLRELMTLDRASSEEEMPTCFLASESPRRGKNGSARLYTRFGQIFAISYSCAPLTGNGGFGAVYVLRDETEKKQLLDNLREMAFHDTLTRLPNRRAVEGRLARALRTARDLAEQHAFCYIDLDQFKLVNDTCGHAVGDSLLQDIAQTMRAALPNHAYLGRLGGDEFGLILFDTLPDEAMRVCRAVVQRIRDFRFEHKGRRFTLGACAGIASITREAASAGDIMVQADMACYRAKSEGSGRVMLYEADEVGFRRLEAEMGWAADFAHALEANQFLPYRQLIQPTSGNGQPHYEVLIRWQRNGVIEGPAKLLSALERYGQAPILDRWMVEAVISWLAARPDDNAVYFINLSGKTVADESFLDVVCSLLDHYGVPGARLGFEVTETAAVVNLEDAQRLIQGLRPRGCQFALDDFGRDASSFFYLKHLPADYLKIDGAFVRGMLTDSRDQAIVRSIAQLARDFGMHSIAEQVEDAGMMAMLNEIGVDYLQGYHIHRPEAFPGWQAMHGAQPGARPARPAHLSIVK